MKRNNDSKRAPLVPREPKEVLKQATTYADAITAFSVAQSVAFAFAVGSGDKLPLHVQQKLPYVFLAIVIALAVYICALYLCHRNEDRLAGEPDPSTAVGATVVQVRWMRYGLVVVGFLLTAFIGWSTQVK